MASDLGKSLTWDNLLPGNRNRPLWTIMRRHYRGEKYGLLSLPVSYGLVYMLNQNRSWLLLPLFFLQGIQFSGIHVSQLYIGVQRWFYQPAMVNDQRGIVFKFTEMTLASFFNNSLNGPGVSLWGN